MCDPFDQFFYDKCGERKYIKVKSKKKKKMDEGLVGNNIMAYHVVSGNYNDHN